MTVRGAVVLLLSCGALASGCSLFEGRCRSGEDCPAWARCETETGSCIERQPPDSGPPVSSPPVQGPSSVGGGDAGPPQDAGPGA